MVGQKGPKKGTVNNPKGKNQYTLGGAVKMVGSMIYNPYKQSNERKAAARTQTAKNNAMSASATYSLNRDIVNRENNKNIATAKVLRDKAIAKRREAETITGIKDFFTTPKQAVDAKRAANTSNNFTRAVNKRVAESEKILATFSNMSVDAGNKYRAAAKAEERLKKANNADAYEKRYINGYINQTRNKAANAAHSLFGNHTSRKK